MIDCHLQTRTYLLYVDTNAMSKVECKDIKRNRKDLQIMKMAIENLFEKNHLKIHQKVYKLKQKNK